MKIIKDFNIGVYDSVSIWYTFLKLIESNNKDILDIYTKIILYNLLCITINIITLQIIIPTFWSSPMLEIFVIFIWTIPQYIITLIYNSFYTNELIKLYLEDQKYSNNTYNCYSKYSEYLVNKFYYQVVIVFLLIESSIITQIPVIGRIIDAIFTSLVYSYYTWEYTWSQYKIPHRIRYDIFENNWTYYLGYTMFIGIIKYYFNYFTSYHIISILFPFISLNCLNKYRELPCDKENNWYLPIFKIPIYYTHFVINKLTKFLQKK